LQISFLSVKRSAWPAR